MPGRDVVLIGGFDALRRLLGGLPAGCPRAYWSSCTPHRAPTSQLPEILARSGLPPAAYAVPGQRLTPGLVTIAPPGQHLVVTDGDVLRLHRGPLVHRVRPAADVLLHSAARHCGDRAIAVVLSGRLRDGAEGAAAVAATGGAVLVQDPADAASPDMPAATLARVLFRAREERMRRAAELITDHVLPNFRPGECVLACDCVT